MIVSTKSGAGKRIWLHLFPKAAALFGGFLLAWCSYTPDAWGETKAAPPTSLPAKKQAQAATRPAQTTANSFLFRPQAFGLGGFFRASLFSQLGVSLGPNSTIGMFIPSGLFDTRVRISPFVALGVHFALTSISRGQNITSIGPGLSLWLTLAEREQIRFLFGVRGTFNMIFADTSTLSQLLLEPVMGFELFPLRNDSFAIQLQFGSPISINISGTSGVTIDSASLVVGAMYYF